MSSESFLVFTLGFNSVSILPTLFFKVSFPVVGYLSLSYMFVLTLNLFHAYKTYLDFLSRPEVIFPVEIVVLLVIFQFLSRPGFILPG